MLHACAHVIHMPRMIQLRSVPDALHRKLKARAAMASMSLSDYLTAEIRRVAERPTLEEMRERLASLEPVSSREKIVAAIRADRDSR